jgi:hypothetical protein
MFATLSLKELKQLVRDLKNNHNIAGYSRMKKEDLVKALSARFVFLHGAIYLKYEDEDRAESQRIQNELDKAEAPAVEPKNAKPRAKKTKPEAEPERKTNAQLQSRMIKFFKGLSEKELASTMQHKIRQFEKLEGTDLSEMQKQLFNGLYVSFYS